MVHVNNDHILFYKKFLGPEIANISKKWYKSTSNFCTTQTINIKVKSEIQQFQVVCDCSEYLKSQMLILLDRVEDAEHSGGGGAHHEEDDDGDQDDHQHPLLGVLENLLTVPGPRTSPVSRRGLRSKARRASRGQCRGARGYCALVRVSPGARARIERGDREVCEARGVARGRGGGGGRAACLAPAWHRGGGHRGLTRLRGRVSRRCLPVLERLPPPGDFEKLVDDENIENGQSDNRANSEKCLTDPEVALEDIILRH